MVAWVAPPRPVYKRAICALHAPARGAVRHRGRRAARRVNSQSPARSGRWCLVRAYPHLAPAMGRFTHSESNVTTAAASVLTSGPSDRAGSRWGSPHRHRRLHLLQFCGGFRPAAPPSAHAAGNPRPFCPAIVHWGVAHGPPPRASKIDAEEVKAAVGAAVRGLVREVFPLGPAQGPVDPLLFTCPHRGGVNARRHAGVRPTPPEPRAPYHRHSVYCPRRVSSAPRS